jgi:hypothetical protein
VRHHEFGVSSAAHDSHHTVARLPEYHVGSDGFDGPRVLQARYILGGIGRGRVLSDPLNEVGTVHSRRSYPNPYLLGSRLGAGNIPDFENFRTSEFGDDHRPHGFGHVSLFGIRASSETGPVLIVILKGPFGDHRSQGSFVPERGYR